MGVLLRFIDIMLTLYSLLFFARALLSWFLPPHDPVMGMVNALTEPVLVPLRRVLPMAGGIDFSPMVAALLIYLLRMAVMAVGQAWL
jgi:YggT family protein